MAKTQTALISKRLFLKAMISKLALYNPGANDIVEVSWDSGKKDFTARDC
jgi:hypothetical protein